jgi:hypothetical protein
MNEIQHGATDVSERVSVGASASVAANVGEGGTLISESVQCRRPLRLEDAPMLGVAHATTFEQLAKTYPS